MPIHLYRSSHPTGLGTALDVVRQRWAALRRRGAGLALFVGLLLAGAAQAQTGNVTVDASFDPGGTGLNSGVTSIAVQPDGKVLIGGDFTTFNGTSISKGIARLNADGTVDPSFNPGGAGLNSPANSIALQSDGKVLIVGNFTTFNDASISKGIARLTANGTLDPSFNPGGAGPNNDIYSIAVQPVDGKVLIGGFFTTFNGTPISNHIARLNADGTVDPSFNLSGTGLNNPANSIALQSNGKVLVGGFFTEFNDTPISAGIARLNADGSLDPSFNPGGAGLDGGAFSVVLQPDGKVLIYGSFTTFNGTPISNNTARLSADGTLDTSFSLGGTGLNGWVNAIAVQPDGKVLIGGSFTDYNGTARNHIVRLMPDGSLDTSFDPGTGLDGWVNSIAVQPDGKVLIGGDFTEFNGTTRNRIARLAFPLTATASVPGGLGRISPGSYNATSGTIANFTLSPDAGYVVDTVTGTCGGTLSGTTFTTTALSADCTVIASFKPAASPAGTATATPVPTLGPWALAGLLGLMGLWGGRHLRRA